MKRGDRMMTAKTLLSIHWKRCAKLFKVMLGALALGAAATASTPGYCSHPLVFTLTDKD